MSVRKTFPSLKRPKRGGVMPQNRLGSFSPSVSIPIPVEAPTQSLIESSRKAYVVNVLNSDTQTRQLEVKTCFHIGINVFDYGLKQEPSVSVVIEKLEYNGTEVFSDAAGVLQMCISRDEQLLYFIKGHALIDKLVLPQRCIADAVFDDDYSCAVLVFSKNYGYVSVMFHERAVPIYKFLERNHDAWIQYKLKKRSVERVRALHAQELRRRENAQRDPLIVVRADDADDLETPSVAGFAPEPKNDIEFSSEPVSDDVLRSGLPSLPKQGKLKPYTRRTRSAVRGPGPASDAGGSLMSVLGMGIGQDTTFSEDEFDLAMAPIPRSVSGAGHEQASQPVERETPAPFEPPLQHTVGHDKKFIIAYNDFKTLYNNDWVNDTLIDFFIAYEIERAVHELRSIGENEVYAFNSFFFTKLFQKPEGSEKPPYYENIRRWLAKVDLMSYGSVVIPINEHLHWYCAVIKNLPALLEYSRYKQAEAQIAENEKENENENKNEYENENERGADSAVAAAATAKNPAPRPPKPTVEVFLIDSLKQNHTNLHAPLREVIREYCKEKHGVDACTELLRFKSARVQRQQNFNDCGVHVIFNIRKWLENLAVGELSWKTHGKSKDNVFHGIERHGMRRACIDFLLDLHAKQPPPASSSDSKTPEDAQSDDEVELISYSAPNGTVPEGSTEKEGQNANNKRTESPDKADILEKLRNVGSIKDVNTSAEMANSADNTSHSAYGNPTNADTSPFAETNEKHSEAENSGKWQANISDILNVSNSEPAPEQKPTLISTPDTSREKATDILPREIGVTNDYAAEAKPVEFVLKQSKLKTENAHYKFDYKTDYTMDHEPNDKSGKSSHSRSDLKMEFKVHHKPGLKVDHRTDRQSEATSTYSSVASKLSRTLDPRVIEQTESKWTNPLSKLQTRLVIHHPQIRKHFSGDNLANNTTKFLNEVCTDTARRYSELTLEKLRQLVAEYNKTETEKGASHVNAQEIENKIREILKKPRDPMDQPFVIKDLDEASPGTDEIAADADDSNGELNKSVGELTISGRVPEKSSLEGTPEATKRFMQQTEAESLAHRSAIRRNTRARAKQARDNSLSGLEIVDDSEDDEVELVSEISLVLSSPSDIRRAPRKLQTRNARETPRPRQSYIPDEYDNAISKMKIPKVSDSAEVYEVTEIEHTNKSPIRDKSHPSSHKSKRRRVDDMINKRNRS